MTPFVNDTDRHQAVPDGAGGSLIVRPGYMTVPGAGGRLRAVPLGIFAGSVPAAGPGADPGAPVKRGPGRPPKPKPDPAADSGTPPAPPAAGPDPAGAPVTGDPGTPPAPGTDPDLTGETGAGVAVLTGDWTGERSGLVDPPVLPPAA